MNLNYKLRNLFLLLLLPLSSCIIPFRSFDKSKPTAPPDYSQTKYWAALPTIKDSADIVPYNSNLKDEQANAKADVFFIYPTIYWIGKHWNANVNNHYLNYRIQKTTIRHQATAFNGSCKIYSPYYRQAALYSYTKLNGSGKKALDFAYQDVKAAFEYYLKNYNNGRPIIIASHSQGSQHADQLLHDYFEKDSVLRKRLVAAYVIGGNVQKHEFKNIPPSDSATQTGCIICWNARRTGEIKDQYFEGDFECVNPLTWKRDTVLAPLSLNHGSVPWEFAEIDQGIADAQVSPIGNGLLWVHKKNQTGFQKEHLIWRWLFGVNKRYHILDYNLYWMNIRENVKQRVDAYLNKKGQ
jgi:hypothetical protein